MEGLTACGLEVAGKKVLLMPQLAAFDATNAVNTHASVLAAAFAVLGELGATEVRVGAGSEFYRDTMALAEAAGYRDSIPNFDDVFVDLNADDVETMAGFSNKGQILLPVSAMRADLVVSLAKMKTDVCSGASLSMMNLFGLVPANVYGWPPDAIHGLDFPTSVFELTRIFRRSFAIVDGIVGMENGGPLKGDSKAAGVLIMGRDLPAVDATCCRVMGLDPHKIDYLKLSAGRQGIIEEGRIEQRGEAIEHVRSRFVLPMEQAELRLA